MTSTSQDQQLPRTLSRDQFEEVAADCYELSTSALEQLKEVPSMLLLGTLQDGTPFLEQGGLFAIDSDADKQRLVVLMTALVDHPRIDFVVHITEAWVLANPKAMPKRSIAKHPKRTEAVLFNILSKDCQAIVMNPLQRNPLRLERGAIDFSMTLKGRMVRETPPPN